MRGWHCTHKLTHHGNDKAAGSWEKWGFPSISTCFVKAYLPTVSFLIINQVSVFSWITGPGFWSVVVYCIIVIFKVTNLEKRMLFCTGSPATLQKIQIPCATFSLLKILGNGRWPFRNIRVTPLCSSQEIFYFIFYSEFLSRQMWWPLLCWWGMGAREVSQIFNNPYLFILKIALSLLFYLILFLYE